MKEDDDDLTRFDLGDLIDLANEIGRDLKEKPSKESAEKLKKVATEIIKKAPKQNSPTVQPPRVAYAQNRLRKEVTSRTAGLSTPPPRGRLR